MQDDSIESPEQDTATTRSPKSFRLMNKPKSGFKGSIWGALILLAWDAGFSGSFLMSYMFCPIWFLGSVLNNAVQRPGWTIAIIRIAFPVVTLGLVLLNNEIQLGIANKNAQVVVAACEQFHADKGKFPKTLDELVPDFLPSVPPAKYCLTWGEFWYFNFDDSDAMLFWYEIPPYGRRIYNFQKRQWSFLD